MLNPRIRAANGVFEEYDFTPYVVEEHDGWNECDLETHSHLYKVVYLRAMGSDGDDPSLKATFHVLLDKGGHIYDVHCLETSKGQEVGVRPKAA